MLRKFSERQVERNREHDEKRKAATGPPIVFEIPAFEQIALNEWNAEHRKTCSLLWHKDGTKVEFPGGAMGGGLTYQFTPTGIGVAMSVKCHCGDECNITDFDSW